MKRYLAACIAILSFATSCSDFLSKENPNSIESEFFFKDENSLVIYTNTLTRSWVPEIIDFVNGDRYTDTHGWDSRYNYVSDVAPGYSIGGDRFGNYEGLLPRKSGRV